jgi:hypothetical protein
MDPRQIDNAVEKHIPTVRVIAIAFAASVLVYAAVAYLLIGVLGGTALISMLVHWPRRAAIEDFLQQQGLAR